ncbi:hypothetical protein SAMN05216266_110150 [Amycolatopsis marina]|uniref:Uncharacterized protein n=1 Tax=Amycolatopsis marina TaxID=490629 RepID=A0A1I1AXR5_9PSEU|nr:hypothetical protein SAMN05216266_110150 [Amycolatopsis marina]
MRAAAPIVLLDEVTSAVDPVNGTAVWNMSMTAG